MINKKKIRVWGGGGGGGGAPLPNLGVGRDGAAVVAMPDPTYGERACAFVELRSGSGGLELSDLVDHLRDRGVSVENWPEKLVIKQEIPRGSGGKVAKGVLRREIETILESNGVQKPPEID